MKVFLALLLTTSATFLFAGCESDMPPAPPREHPGRVPGQITQPDRSEDPMIKENTRVGY